MSGEDIIKGEQGFKEEKKSSKDIITKEETMFKIGPDGKAIPEKYPVYIYNHNLDTELIDESLLLMESIKKQEAISNVLEEYKAKQNKDIEDLKNKIDKVKGMEEVREKVNAEVISNGVKESRKIIQKLKDMKEKEKQTKYIELIPCTSSEAYLTFEKGRTIDNKETDDWVANLISKKCFNPQYSFEEAKKLRPDFKIAIKNAIMEASDYKIESYRDIMMRLQLEEQKPLTLKKG